MGMIELNSIGTEGRLQRSMLYFAAVFFLPNNYVDDYFILSAIKQFQILWTEHGLLYKITFLHIKITLKKSNDKT